MDNKTGDSPLYCNKKKNVSIELSKFSNVEINCSYGKYFEILTALTQQ